MGDQPNFFGDNLFFPDDTPFTPDQRAWLNGYFAGLNSSLATRDDASVDAVLKPVHILYGSQTGNAEMVAMDAAENAATFGLSPNVMALDDMEIEDLVNVERLLIVTSTYGEGEMPDNAEIFWQTLNNTTAPRLDNTHFAVLALGDTSYDGYCEAGKLLDLRLEQLGAKRIQDRIDCDIDYEDLAAKWIEDALPEIGKFGEQAPAAGVPEAGVRGKVAKAISTKSKWNRKTPYAGSLNASRLLSGKGSKKEICHYELGLGDSGIEYAAGDALGVVPLNNPELVAKMIETLGAKPDTPVKGDVALSEALTSQLEIFTPSKEFLATVAERGCDEELSRIVGNGDKDTIEDFLWSKDTLDLLRLYPRATFSAEEFTALMKPLQHRAYSISSSPLAHADEIHLTIATVRFESHGRKHGGVCSSYLRNMLNQGDMTGIFVSPNKSFRPPEDNDAPMIMVGPGTGVAPFRAFLQERAARGAKGKNWLFFGDQTQAHDYIYEDEMVHFAKDGILTKLDLAFSRDQKEKVYVQTRMRENAKELYAWLEEGGKFYICGDATRMAKDVDVTLHDIIAEQGAMNEEAAEAYVMKLKKDKRYLRDVY